MNSLKLSNAAKILSKPIGLRSSLPKLTARNLSLTPQNNRLFGRPSYDDTFFGLASNLMRSLEREFDFARRQMDKNVDLLPQTYLPAMFSRPTDIDYIITDKEGNRKLKLSFDLSEFEPEEIKVKTHGHNLKISAKRERKSDTDYFLKEFTQNYSLPKELKLEDLKSKWSEDGVLTIEAQLPKQIESKQPKEKEIPIEHGKETKNITEGGEEAGKVASGYAGSQTNETQKKS